MKASVALCLFAGVLLAGCATDPYKKEFYPMPYKQDVSFEDYSMNYETCEAKADEEAGESYTATMGSAGAGGGAFGAFAGGLGRGLSDGIAYANWAKAHGTVLGRCMLAEGYVYRRITNAERRELDQTVEGTERRRAWWMFVSGQRPTTPYPDDETDINRKIREGTL